MAGDYTKFRRHYQDVSFDYDLATGTSGPVTLLTVRNANYQIFIQRITISVVTFAAKTLTLQDSAGTPVVIAVASIPATESTVPGIEPYEYDFGEVGTALTIAKNFVLALSAAGAAARIHVDAYQRLGKTIGMNDGASLQ